MLDHSTFQNSDIPYIELPEGAREVALGSIKKYGFEPLERYNLFSIRENLPVKANILAFAHRVHRTPEYTGLTVFNAVSSHEDSEIVTLLARSAAPFHLIHRGEEFSFWGCPVQNQVPVPRLIENHISYNQLDTALSKYTVDLKPQVIVDVKQGHGTFTMFRDIQPLQLSLWASGVTSGLLVKHFASTVSELRKLMGRRLDIQNLPDPKGNELVTRLSIQLLSAIILADTGVLGEDMRLKRPSLGELIQKVTGEFERYFDLKIFSDYFFEAEQAYQLLQKICYASFVPDMLKELYKAAYSKEERKASGSYDTPIHLTRRIWKNIPLEYLPPKMRMVADMTCGWGSFLVAGHERLSGLRDMGHVTLHDQIHGNDSAYFTSQLAGLGLLLATSEDSWNIQCYDALDWPWLNANQPHIIVGNPPFGGNRKKLIAEEPLWEENARYEKANAFLENAIRRLAPNGYLAMLMPSSFMAAEASPLYRKLLLESCDILELWDIPAGLFDAWVQTTVIFAQKKERPKEVLHFPVRVRTIQKHTLKHLGELQIFTASGLFVDQAVWDEQKRKSIGSANSYIMDYKIILSEASWQSISQFCVDLQNLVEIFRGVTKGKKLEKKRNKDYPNPKEVPLLSGVRYVMPSKRDWWLDYSRSETIIYPNDLKEPVLGKESLLAGIKVLVSYDSKPSWGKRVRVAIERRGNYVSDHYYVVTPKSLAQERHITHEVIAAILSWDVSNAWIVEHLKSPAIPKRAINTVPFPIGLSERDCSILTQTVRQIESAVDANEQIPVEATEIIDSILKRAYHLDDATFARLRQVKEWNSKPQITLDPLPYSEEANCLISGIVESVDAVQGTITLWMKGFDELQTVQIVPTMPGWMLRPNVAFRTEIPRRYIKSGIISYNNTDWGLFRPQPNTYLSEEELLEEFANFSR